MNSQSYSQVLPQMKHFISLCIGSSVLVRRYSQCQGSNSSQDKALYIQIKSKLQEIDRLEGVIGALSWYSLINGL